MAPAALPQGKTPVQRMGGALLWALVAVVFGLCGWDFAAKPVFTIVGNWNVARDYREVPATVVTRAIKASDGNTYTWPAARYAVDGKEYVAERLTLLESDSLDHAANTAASAKLEAARQANTPVSVWVSPRKAHIAVVSRELPTRTVGSRIPMMIAFAVITLAGVWGFLGALLNLPAYTKLTDAGSVWAFAIAWSGFVFPLGMIIVQDAEAPIVVVICLGLFGLAGIALLWSAVNMTLKGTGRNFLKTSTVAQRQRATAKKTVARTDSVKRGGLGGHGSDFDKD